MAGPPASQTLGQRQRVLKFGPFEVDENAFELRRDGDSLRLPRQVLELIFFLVKTRGELVTIDDLIQGPWRGATVGQAAVSRAIMLARRALAPASDHATLSETASYIVTVRGKGYRFVGAPTEVPPTRPSVVILKAKPESAPSPLECELRVLYAASRRASAGLGSIIVVSAAAATGEIDPFELVERFAAQLSWQGTWVSRVRCKEGASSPPLSPWLEVVRAAVGEDADAISDPSYEALARSLFRKAYERSWVVCIEDLQWADDDSMLMLDFVRRRIAHVPLLIVGTCCRPESLDRLPLREMLEVAPAHVDRTTETAGGSVRLFLSLG